MADGHPLDKAPPGVQAYSVNAYFLALV